MHSTQTKPDTSAKANRPERTCAGCGQKDDPSDLVRVVAGPDGQVAVDLAGSGFGRGAWVHASLACVAKAAPRGLARSLKCAVETKPAELASAIAAAAERRVEGLLASAVRAKRVLVGGDAVSEGLATGEVHVVVVAKDAQAAAQLSEVSRAVASGRAVAWGDKARIGRFLGRPEVALLGVRDARIAGAVRDAVRLGSNVASKVVATEDR